MLGGQHTQAFTLGTEVLGKHGPGKPTSSKRFQHRAAINDPIGHRHRTFKVHLLIPHPTALGIVGMHHVHPFCVDGGQLLNVAPGGVEMEKIERNPDLRTDRISQCDGLLQRIDKLVGETRAIRFRPDELQAIPHAHRLQDFIKPREPLTMPRKVRSKIAAIRAAEDVVIGDCGSSANRTRDLRLDQRQAVGEIILVREDIERQVKHPPRHSRTHRQQSRFLGRSIIRHQLPRQRRRREPMLTGQREQLLQRQRLDAYATMIEIEVQHARHSNRARRSVKHRVGSRCNLRHNAPMTQKLSQNDLLAAARDVLRSEAASIASIADRLGPRIVAAIQLIHDRTSTQAGVDGALVVSGIGKSGLVGQRISASFASTGTPSHFLHPVEALHGDLGRVRRQDVVLLLSYSGETEELIKLADALKRLAVPMLAITSRTDSTLGKVATITIDIGNIEEVCPHGLAPTTTVNCISAVGDALVLGVMSLRQFSKEDFAAFHPGGSLGRKLLKVGQVMEFKRGENFVPLAQTLTVGEVLAKDSATGRRAGAVVLIDDAGKLAGVFTDGDLRRHLRATPNLMSVPISQVMTKNPKRINENALASEALAILNQYRIDELPVVNDAGEPVGLIDVQDLVRLRIVE